MESTCQGEAKASLPQAANLVRREPGLGMVGNRDDNLEESVEIRDSV